MLQWVHILPVVVSAAAVFGIGALWYSPVLFGKQWVAAHGLTDEKIQSMRASAGRAYAVSFSAHMFSEKPLAAYWIDASYRVVYCIVMGAILAAWR
jgi:Protein of unknown function (DUF1761)